MSHEIMISKPAAIGQPVDGTHDRLAEVRQFLQSAKTAKAVIRICRLALGRSFQVPSGAEEAVSGRGENGCTQVVIVAECRKHIAHDAAGGGIDGVGLWPVNGDFQHPAIDGGANGALRSYW